MQAIKTRPESGRRRASQGTVAFAVSMTLDAIAVAVNAVGTIGEGQEWIIR